MKRWLFGVLLLCNAVVLAWQWDAFARWGWGPNAKREPERLTQQIRPEALSITLPPHSPASTAQVAPTPAAASEAAPQTPSQAAPTAEPASAPTPPTTGNTAAKANR
ncbi:hypothetical protein B9Z51_12445 [Limnohabitans sp. T6-5]|uniref:hypothetical protein n=1 Tax=Limnohabitans sp. T6-5 TaxID=1100724 RepID=UPI000D3D60AB|nr:hypothetical protein [Limnohabitans sp. T6-5]PUE06748.1 hypothetical protein B9Z51_12445 [Limnohabitans sp. T6-5]